MTITNFRIKTSIVEIHPNWDLISGDTIFLRTAFLQGLEESCPINVQNFYIEFFSKFDLVGIALFQHIDLKNIKPFQVAESTLKSKTSSWLINTFASSILFIGNNMMSGNNGFRFLKSVEIQEQIASIQKASKALKKQLKSEGKKVQLSVWKDFEIDEIQQIEKFISEKYYRFSIQPNMIFELPASTKSESDYIALLSKKYRDQYKRARKKSSDIDKRQLSLSEIEQYQDRISELYSTTVANASFNTFRLPADHFASMKQFLGADFQLYAYFLEEKLIGFNTIIKNGEILEPYFLGYDADVQKSRLLYLNMLYDIIGYAATKKFTKIIFGRTALEIKSSVGAKPVELFGFIHHSNPIINKFIARIFMSVEPKIDWKVRNPFKPLQ